MKHLGNISNINGAEIDPVDLITFGSPCQDLSVAGKRAGIKHAANGDEEATRSGLFMEAVRIIKEMREATNGKYPRFALWENVPGAFSSNKGEDFRIVCEEIIKIVEKNAIMPQVPKTGWPYADSYRGNGWSLAYRTFDAQYWGVPQRRRRIHLVADFSGECAAEILFKREGVRGNHAQGRTPWQVSTADAESSIGTTDSTGRATISLSVMPVVIDSIGGQAEAAKETNIVPTLKASHYKFPPCIALSAGFCTEHSANAGGIGYQEECAPTLRAGVIPAGVCVTDVGFFNSYDEQSPTLLARSYKDPHLVAYPEEHIHYTVRRLTPTECARLQGFADSWGHPDRKDDMTEDEYMFWLDVRNTHAAINGRNAKEYSKAQMLTWYNKLHTDSAEYKMWGNGIALPPALYCMQGIADVLQREAVN